MARVPEGVGRRRPCRALQPAAAYGAPLSRPVLVSAAPRHVIVFRQGDVPRAVSLPWIILSRSVSRLAAAQGLLQAINFSAGRRGGFVCAAFSFNALIFTFFPFNSFDWKWVKKHIFPAKPVTTLFHLTKVLDSTTELLV